MALDPNHPGHFPLFADDLQLPMLAMAGFNAFEKADPLPWHTHDEFELTFSRKGRVYFEVEGSDDLVLTNRDVGLTQPHVRHRGLNNVTQPCEMHWIQFDLAEAESTTNTPFTNDDLAYLRGIFASAGDVVVEGTPRIPSLLAQFRSEVLAFHSDESRELVVPKLRTLLCQLILESATSFAAPGKHHWSQEAQHCYTYVLANYRNPITVAEIAEDVGRSETYVHNIFKQEIGQSPHDLICRLRIQYASRKLKESQSSVTDIAFDAGFSSSQHFSSVFSRYLGRTPSAFRQEQGS